VQRVDQRIAFDWIFDAILFLNCSGNSFLKTGSATTTTVTLHFLSMSHFHPHQGLLGCFRCRNGFYNNAEIILKLIWP